ncbi:MAG: hypothetical protein O2913_07275 [Chloroflexi bacterium]|nr:hypothetical protein [Chloroflexota bacterium]
MRIINLALLISILAIFFIVACGGGSATSDSSGDGETVKNVASEVSEALPIWRYVNSGWVSPMNEPATNAISRELRAAVITSAQEMEEFNRTVVSKRMNGTSASLSRPEFPDSVVLVAYLMWLPVQGDPLSVVGIDVVGNRAVVELELDDDSQGREYPYLYAPMTMVTVDRSEFPGEGQIEFEFRLDDETVATVTDNLE